MGKQYQLCLCVPCKIAGNCACDNSGYCNGNYIMFNNEADYLKAKKKQGGK